MVSVCAAMMSEKTFILYLLVTILWMVNMLGFTVDLAIQVLLQLLTCTISVIAQSTPAD
jgi:hypothetical protein